MRAVVVTAYGPPDVLQLREVPQPSPKDDEVLIKVHVSTVTAGDCELRRFDMPVLFWIPLRILVGIRRPRGNLILGQELAGEVEAVGHDVTQFKEGDRVFAATDIRFGGHAEYKCLSEDGAVARMAANMSYEEAAAVPVGGLNALHFLRIGKVQRGQQVLVYGSSGSIGTFAVQLARHFGAEVTAVCSTAKVDMVRSLGARNVIDYTREDFTENGQTYDIIFDTIGKSPFSRSLRSLKQGGYYLLANPGLRDIVRGLWTSMTGSKNVVVRFADQPVEDLILLRDLIEAGEIRSVIDRRYPLEQAAEAHRYVEEGHKAGNVVITVSHDYSGDQGAAQ